jgi:para-aminobenzoate synthetase component 1
MAFEENADGWTFETRAGGGITADSDPVDEDAEAEAKIAAIRGALTAQAGAFSTLLAAAMAPPSASPAR